MSPHIRMLDTCIYCLFVNSGSFFVFLFSLYLKVHVIEKQ